MIRNFEEYKNSLNFHGVEWISHDNSNSHVGCSELRLISTNMDCAIKCRHLTQFSFSAEHTAHQKILLQRCWTEIRMVRLISSLFQNGYFLVKKDGCPNVYVIWLVPSDEFRVTTVKYAAIASFLITNVMVQLPVNRHIWDSVVRTFIIITYEYWICSRKPVAPWYSGTVPALPSLSRNESRV